MSDSMSLENAQQHLNDTMKMMQERAKEMMKTETGTEALRLELAALQGCHPSEVHFEE